jgi:hypothetical protein
VVQLIAPSPDRHAISAKIAVEIAQMARISPNRALLTAVVGLAALGTLALGGLVSPFASDYFAAASTPGDAAISTPTLSPSLVRIHVAPPETAHLTVMRDGKPETLVFELDPDCPPASGWV